MEEAIGRSFQLIGRGLHKVIRQAAKIPYMLKEDLEVANQTGTVFNLLQGDLSEETYEELCADTADVMLETIYYCQTELSSVHESLRASRRLLNSTFDETEQKKRLINHDFLVLKIQSGPRHRHTQQTPIYIFAEKLGTGGGNKAGIYICTYKGDEADINTNHSLHSIDCRSSRFGSLHNLEENLTHSPDYDVMHNNCWDYATKTTKLLLNACIQIANNSVGGEGECRRLQKELNKLEANFVGKHVLNQAKRAVKFVT